MTSDLIHFGQLAGNTDVSGKKEKKETYAQQVRLLDTAYGHSASLMTGALFKEHLNITIIQESSEILVKLLQPHTY